MCCLQLVAPSPWLGSLFLFIGFPHASIPLESQGSFAFALPHCSTFPVLLILQNVDADNAPAQQPGVNSSAFSGLEVPLPQEPVILLSWQHRFCQDQVLQILSLEGVRLCRHLLPQERDKD